MKEFRRESHDYRLNRFRFYANTMVFSNYAGTFVLADKTTGPVRMAHQQFIAPQQWIT